MTTLGPRTACGVRTGNKYLNWRAIIVKESPLTIPSTTIEQSLQTQHAGKTTLVVGDLKLTKCKFGTITSIGRTQTTQFGATSISTYIRKKSCIPMHTRATKNL